MPEMFSDRKVLSAEIFVRTMRYTRRTSVRNASVMTKITGRNKNESSARRTLMLSITTA